MSHRTGRRTEVRPAVVESATGSRSVVTTAAFIDRKQRLARKAAAEKQIARREARLERRYDIEPVTA